MTLDVLKWKNRQTGLQVEAVQFKAQNGHDLVRWTGGDAQFLVTGRINDDREFEHGYSLTLPHQQIATPGDFIIKGLEDVFWVTKAGVLFQTYDQVFEKPKLVITHSNSPSGQQARLAEGQAMLRGLSRPRRTF